MKAVQQKWFVIVALAFMLCLAGLIISGTVFAQQCVDNRDGTVTDNGTGLMWQKATAGPMNWNDAMSYASGLSLGGHSGWRLPTKDELVGLYNSPYKGIMDVVNDWYWSSSPYAGRSNSVWLVDFNGGFVCYYDVSLNRGVRAVRSAQ